MVSSGRQAIACILLLLSTAASAQSQSAPDKGPTSSISGKITVKGKGVSGIVVGLVYMDRSRSDTTTRFRAVTDDEGNYRIANVPPGSYEVVVSAPVYISATGRKSLIVGKNEAVENIDLALVRGGVITGRVSDAEGRPVVEEQVTVDPEFGDHGFVRPIQTDDRGIYRAFGLAPGRYRVSAGQEEGYSFGDSWDRGLHRRTFHPDVADPSQATMVEVSEGSEATNVDITLGRALLKYTARGRIIDGETGQPVANVHYGVQMFIDPNRSSTKVLAAVSTTDGQFKLDNLSPGKYAVFVEPSADSEWRADPVRFEVTDQDVEGLVVKTSKGTSASGVIILEGVDDKTVQARLSKAWLLAYVNQSHQRGSRHTARINPDGSFRVGGLAPGLLNFWLTSADRLQVVRLERDGIVYSKGLTIAEKEQITGIRVIVNHANATVRGVVKYEGSMPPNSQITVSVRKTDKDPSIPSSDQSVAVDARGQFLIEGLLPGTYYITALVSIFNGMLSGPGVTQQVVVTNGAVTNVSLTLQPSQSSPYRP